MAIAMEYVDVVSYNIYQNPPNRSFQYKELKNKKPLMVTEYGVERIPSNRPGDRITCRLLQIKGRRSSRVTLTFCCVIHSS